MNATYTVTDLIRALLSQAQTAAVHRAMESDDDDALVEDPTELRFTQQELAHLCTDAIEYVGCLACVWCGVDTGQIDEYYFVRNEIWQRYGSPRGCLCIGCLEDRMGRRLRADDFKDAFLNPDPGGTPPIPSGYATG